MKVHIAIWSVGFNLVLFRNEFDIDEETRVWFAAWVGTRRVYLRWSRTGLDRVGENRFHFTTGVNR